ncbi:type II toxin-antitoxin system RelE/ParE family toxin [Thermococcus sp. ES12]|uniref:type II toxin-antitoxin system RelE family toxin n=1 Tax=Thermococcus sp. ES12 TaxID=1638246 RepID=UPI0014301E68|nr:type II toxin-antitoxin system RelE/ParE family toxin [Thermococcus sp. ES12]NJE76115.1 type II toxin-antitoxin system RelE/ParE family toxin [Thermococcus sp. ES12]
MTYQVLLHRNVVKNLKDAPEGVKKKFGELIEELRFNPIPSEKFDIKKIKGRKNTFRVRLGEYRVIYELRRKELLILNR